MTDRTRFYAEIGARIRKQRERQGLTQQALASMVSLSRASLANIERGKQKTLLDTFVDLAAALQVAPGKLLNDLQCSTEDLVIELMKDRPQSEREWVLSGVRTAGKDR